VLFYLAYFPHTSASQQQSLHEVVLIQSYDTRAPWGYRLNDGIRESLYDSGMRTHVYTEYLNADFWKYEEEQLIMRRICERARQRNVSVIVTHGDEAYYALMHCGDSLPHQIPVVVSGVKYSNVSTQPNVCGFTSRIDYLKLLEDARRLFPDRKEIISLVDNSALSRMGNRELHTAFEQFKALHPEYNMVDLNAEDQGMRSIATICYSHIAYQYVIIAPKWSNFHSFIGKNSKAPIFGGQVVALTNGVFAVDDASPYDVTYDAGKLVAQIINGVSPQELGVQNEPGILTYDYKQLVYFKISPDRVGSKSLIMDMPATVKYRTWIITAYVVVCGGLLLLFLWLNRMRRREVRRRTYAQTRLLVQNRLVEQRNEFDNIFNSLSDGLVTYDTNLHVHFINRIMIDMIGLDPSTSQSRDFEGIDAGTLFHIYVNGVNIMGLLLEEVRAGQQPAVIPENAFLKVLNNDDYFPISGEVIPIIGAEKLSGVAIMCRNITESEMNKRFFNLAVDVGSIFPWSYDIRKDKLFLSEAYYAFMGLEQRESMTFAEYITYLPPDSEETNIQGFRDVCNGVRSDFTCDYRLMTFSGHYEWCNLRAVAYKGFDADTPYMVMGIVQSIQRFKDAEEQLITARDKALQADKLKSAFLANMSHEIRTPLNSIVGFSDLLRDFDSFSHEEIVQFIDTINVNCTLLLALISDILDLARIEAGSMDFNFSPQDLTPIMQQLYDSQRLTMPEGVELVMDVPDGMGKSIETDPVRLKQVINNFINNAKKFTTHGSITLGYREDEPGYTIFFVRDTGKGIAPEDQKRVFERFYKVDGFTQGAGLGLSISQTIVERFGGVISVESELGVGTCFTVRVPDVAPKKEE
jgi:signal transduction histidine kinase/ABC-type uncharacterized transport system substrate-binding protein